MTGIHTERTIGFAHFVHTDPTSKCFRLHGHNWRIEVDIESEIHKDGMIVDFNVIKSIIDEMDHKVVVPQDLINNPGKKKIWEETNSDVLSKHEFETIAVMTTGLVYEDDGRRSVKYYEFPREDVFIFPREFGAVTSENISKYLWNKFLTVVQDRTERLASIKVTVWEGEKSYAYTEDDAA